MEPSRAAKPIRCISVDVEDYFHIEAARSVADRGDRSRWPSRVEQGVHRFLERFAQIGVRATFFFLGDVAQSHPTLARRCAEAGHEVASHGSGHERLHRLDPVCFRDDVVRSKALLEDQTGRAVLGYRAPTWSITRQTAWAIDVLAELGFAYDASIFPVSHPWYGVPDAPARPFHVRNTAGSAAMLEVPPLVWRFASRQLPVAGGGYFRLLPLGLMTCGLKQAAAEKRPAVLYFHPWEFDPDQPRMPLSLTGRLRTYTGIASAQRRLGHIIERFGPWRPIADHLDALHDMADRTDPFTLRAPAAA